MAQNQTLIHDLTALIKQKDNYTQQKERKIKETIDLLRVPNASAEQRYANQSTPLRRDLKLI